MRAKEERNWFVYTGKIYGIGMTLIASGLTQIEAQELFEETEKNCVRNNPNEYASFGNTEWHEFEAKKLGII